jgi:hypothetical protein
MKKLALISLPLLLAACGGPGAPGTSSATVSASTLNVNLSSVSDAGSTTYTFTNRAGARETTIDTATLTWTDAGTATEKSETVSIPAFTLPAGLTCPTATTPTASCDFNDPATSYGERSVTHAINNADLFRKVLAVNPSVSALPVDVKFSNTANTLGFTFTSTVTSAGGGSGDGGSKPTPVAKPPAPVLNINTLGTGSFSGKLSVSVSGNFDAVSTVDKTILEVTDPLGNVDNTSYVSTSASATFSLDTAKYKDGDLKLRVIALTKEGLRGETAARTVQIANISAPSFEILSPDAGATITGPTTVRVQIREGNTPFTLQVANTTNDVRLNVRDFRGEIVKTAYAKAQQVSPGVQEAFIPLDLIGPNFSSNTYTLELSAVALLSNSASVTLAANTSVSTQVSDNKPPALSVIMPAYITDPYASADVRAIFSRRSALMIQASDDKQVTSIRVDFVCNDSTALPGQECPRAPYTYNIPGQPTTVGNEVLYRVFDIGAQMDGQPYVQNGNYTLRVTAYDGSSANIQEFPLRVSRADVDSDIVNLADQSTVDNIVYDTTPKELNITSARWIVPGITQNDVRVATLTYDNTGLAITPTAIRVDPVVRAGSLIAYPRNFNDVGQYRTDFIVQDLKTGVTRYYQGQPVTVKRNLEKP